MKEVSQELIDELISKWSHVLSIPLSGERQKTAILMESQEKYIANFKHESDNNPIGYIYPP